MILEHLVQGLFNKLQKNLALDFELMSYIMLIISCLKVFQQALIKYYAIVLR